MRATDVSTLTSAAFPSLVAMSANANPPTSAIPTLAVNEDLIIAISSHEVKFIGTHVERTQPTDTLLLLLSACRQAFQFHETSPGSLRPLAKHQRNDRQAEHEARQHERPDRAELQQ